MTARNGTPSSLYISYESLTDTYSLMNYIKLGGDIMNKKSRKVKTFIKEHKKEILIGTGVVITGGLLIKVKTIANIAMNSLNREERRVLFEIKEIAESIERLDRNAPINKFDRIPRKLKRIEELNEDLLIIRKDINKVKKF